MGRFVDFLSNYLCHFNVFVVKLKVGLLVGYFGLFSDFLLQTNRLMEKIISRFIHSD